MPIEGSRQHRFFARTSVPVRAPRGIGRRLRSAGRTESDGAGLEAVAPAVLFAAGALEGDPLHFLLTRRWSLIAPTLLVLALAMALMSGSLPDPVSGGLMAAAMALCLPAAAFSRLEGSLGGSDWRRWPLMLATQALPMLLFGVGSARWTAAIGALDWDVTGSGYVVVVVMATVLLGGRIAAIVAATIALWGGAAMQATTWVPLSLLGVGAVTGLALAVRQSRAGRRDLLQRAEREREQRRAEQLLNEFEETGQGWFWETDRSGRISYVSRRVAAQLGRELQDLLGKPYTSLFQLEDQPNGPRPDIALDLGPQLGREQESERTLVFHFNTRSAFHELSVRAATPDGEERSWSISGRPVLDQFDNFMGFRGLGSDLTEKRRSQQQVAQLARLDSLTKLANRFQMAELLDKILAAPRVEMHACAVFLLDLDRFKQVNDTLGHPAGDALLKQVAERLTSTVGDRGRVGRLGGDEFQIILHGPQQREGLAHLARRIIETLSQPYAIDEAQVVIGASIGIALCPDDGNTSEEIIRNADLALYAAKGRGRGRHHFYDDDLHSDAKERQQLEQDLRDAIADGALELHYQPQVRTTSETVTGFEALLRWNHPVHGAMSPARFVPVAEEAGLVSQIGEWALRTACQELARWPQEVRVAVNVSPLQFADPALPAIVTSAITAAGVEPSRLELEITESVFLGDAKATEMMFGALKVIGVRLALDDFGTGYSSLGYLKKAPFDKIKIDQSFVRGATMPGSRNGAIIASIVSLSEALGMETTAEGVETHDELDLVRMLGCSHVQGYIYEKPLTAQATAGRIADGLAIVASGPRSARSQRQTMLRKVVLEHGGHQYAGTIRNISHTGALVEGLWNVPPDTFFDIHLGDGQVIMAVSRWCREDRMGIEFTRALEIDDTGMLVFAGEKTLAERVGAEREVPAILRRAG